MNSLETTNFVNTFAFSGTGISDNNFTTVTNTPALPNTSITITGTTTGTTTVPNTSGYTYFYPNDFGVGGGQWGNIEKWQFPDVSPFIETPIDLDTLEEGIYDIKGGKVIIKKIKISEEQSKEALEAAEWYDVSPEDRSKICKEISELAEVEEREV